MDRRSFTGGLLAAAAVSPALAAPAPIETVLAAIERRSGGRLGLWLLDRASGRQAGWRGGERFGQCSTFKLSLAACVLAQIDAGRLRGDEVLAYRRSDLMPNSPVTGAHADAGGMTVLALAEAAQKVSDNLAANLLLERIGGPRRLTAFWAGLGAAGCRLDRTEPELNFVPSGEVRDTVTPRGIAQAIGAICGGTALLPASRALLLRWMEETATGKARIRAGLPFGWRSGDKTGTGMRAGMANLVNDIAVTWRPGARRPLVIAAFFQAPGFTPDVVPAHEAVLREVGQAAARWL